METALFIFSFVLLIPYAFLILSYHRFFIKLKQFKIQNNPTSSTTFTVVIPARNEEMNIEKCLRSIYNNKYPDVLFEVIVADDFSTDATAAVISGLMKEFYNLKLISLADHVKDKINSYKKKAIELAIRESKNEWIITTDADCIVPENWLHLFDAYIQSCKPVFVAAPVKFVNEGSFVSIFQCLDFITLQGITAASVSAGLHSMCNGANLAYRKNVFYEVDGFKNVDAIASGDDMLLMHKIKVKHPNKIGYLFNKDVVVSTLPMPDWRSFFNQRIRWASKASNYTDKNIFKVLLLVYFFNLYLLVLIILSFFSVYIFMWLLFLLIVKIICELIFLLPVTEFFNSNKLLWWFPLMQPVHIIYTVFSGFFGKFGTYKWKGRSVK